MPAEVTLQPLSAPGLPAHNHAPPPNHTNLPRFHHSAFTRRIRTRWSRALEYVWACLEIAWAKLQDIWNTTRRKSTLSTWVAISISVIVGALGLRYAYVQVVLSYQALMLAKWTARKDFWELCQEQRVSNNATSAKCELVLRTHFPDPPYVDLGRRSWKQPDRSTVMYEALDLELAQNDNARLTHGVLLSALAAVLLLRNYRRIRRLSNTVLRGSALDNNRTMNRGQRPYDAEDASDTIAVWQMSTGSEMAPSETLRSRGLKKHPVLHQGRRAAKAGNIKDILSTRSERELAQTLYRRVSKDYLIVCQIWSAAEAENIELVATRSESSSAATLRSRGSKKHPVLHQG